MGMEGQIAEEVYSVLTRLVSVSFLIDDFQWILRCTQTRKLNNNFNGRSMTIMFGLNALRL